MKPNYLIKKFENWGEFRDFATDLSSNWIFRGQADSEWALKSSLERTNFFHIYLSSAAAMAATTQLPAIL